MPLLSTHSPSSPISAAVLLANSQSALASSSSAASSAANMSAAASSTPAAAAAASSATPIVPGSGIVGVSTVVYPEGAVPQATLGYWSIRGLGQAIRYVLAFTGTPFADVRYQQGGAPEFSRSAWMDVKSTLDLEFANLPYYTEGSSASGAQVLSLTQSTTILRHLARKHLLYGASLADQARCDLVLDTAYDFKSLLVDTAYSRNRAESLASFAAKSVPHYFAQFESWRAKYSNQRWIAGDNLSIADFFLYEMICQTEIMVPGCMEAYPRLQAFRAQFAALPAIAAYIKSSHYIDRPINNMAGFQ